MKELWKVMARKRFNQLLSLILRLAQDAVKIGVPPIAAPMTACAGATLARLG